MTSLSTDQVRHIAKLARLKLAPEEEKKYANELTKILDYVDMLTTVDTKNVEPTEQVTGLQNSLREDSMKDSIATSDALLATSPLPITDHQIETPSAHG